MHTYQAANMRYFYLGTDKYTLPPDQVSGNFVAYVRSASSRSYDCMALCFSNIEYIVP